MGKVTLESDPDLARELTPTAAELTESVQRLLDEQRLHEARTVARQAAEAWPEDPWLCQANRVLNPDRAVTRPATGKGRKKEFAWLREHASAYRSRWVALLGDQLVASAATFQEVQSALEALNLSEPPLLHYVDSTT